ncbi:MAG TPA: PspC domain-containing protein [Candidatus Saccharimonadales bacterium]|nr:PspC domain-containing protein [Candidatus Saccharimonadales bacterium]
MNEIKHMHLGRTSFTISVEAYKELHEYLQAIKHAAGQDVVDEVEARMAELLTERGLSGDKVLLPSDVKFLKEQLGTPSDFSETEDAKTTAEDDEGSTKRLFRDPDGAMIAGVASGLAKYLGIEVTIIRLVFIALTLLGASGILIYIILWILVPEAKTNSERLQMRGLPVNVDNIKQAISDADVPGATRRATNVIVRFVNGFARVILSVVGIALVVSSVAVLLGAAVALAFGLIRGLEVSGVTLFPIGKEQVAVLVCSFVAVGLMAGMIVASGVALVRRRWSMPGWAIAAVVGLFIATTAVGAGFGVDVAPQVKDRVDSLRHSHTYVLKQPITSVKLLGTHVTYRIVQDQQSSENSVEVNSFGTVNPVKISVTEQKGRLTIDTRSVAKPDCTLFCPYEDSNTTEVIVHAPHADTLTVDAPMGTSVVRRDATTYKEVFRDGNLHYLAPKPASGN